MFLLWCTCLSVYAQDFWVSGHVSDSLSGELLLGANIVDTVSKKGTITDRNGYFSMPVKTPAHLKISFVGYESRLINIYKAKDTLITILLHTGIELEEVVINGPRNRTPDITGLSTEEFRQLPSLGGKPDVAKSLQLLPGISSQREGSSLLLVRGGDPGQNMYLFDDVPVIYVNHLGGFSSVFNPDIINALDVYKGGFPARYGGRISSIVAITHREGNKTSRKGSFGVGASDLSFTFEGPIKTNKMTFIIAGRKTLTDPLMALASKLSEGNPYIIAYGFHDMNGKLTWKPNRKSSFHLNMYYGDDYLALRSDKKKSNIPVNHKVLNVWGNWLVSGHWKSTITPKLFLTSTISTTRYRVKEQSAYTISTGGKTMSFNEKYLSTVQDFSLRTGLMYAISKNWMADFGLQSSLINHVPSYTLSSDQRPSSKNIIKTNETALFLENEVSFLTHSKIILGLRGVNYFAPGYRNTSLEPRFNLTLGITAAQAFHFSYMAANQYAHLLFTAGNIMSNQVWIPSNDRSRPSFSNQYTVGWTGSFNNNMFTTQANLYYKNMNNLITYKEGYSSLKGTTNWQNKIETEGTGRSKGVEILVRKNKGKWTGFFSYTISNTNRQYPGINEGKVHLFDFDRLHSLNLSSHFKINNKLSLNALWVYQSGLSYTPAIGRQFVGSTEPDNQGNLFYYEALIYGERNSMRMKDYHRFDFGIVYNKVTKKGRRATWNFSIYNLYNRANPYVYYYNSNNTDEIIKPEMGGGNMPLQLYQISYFPIIPSIAYKVYFDGDTHIKKSKKPFKQKLKNWLYHEN